MSRNDNKGKPEASASHPEKDSTSMMMFEIGNSVKNLLAVQVSFARSELYKLFFAPLRLVIK